MGKSVSSAAFLLSPGLRTKGWVINQAGHCDKTGAWETRHNCLSCRTIVA